MTTGHDVKQEYPRDIPIDERLPGLSRMMDAGAVGIVLAQRLEEALGKIERCDISYIRYKPSTSCIIAYTLQCSREIIGRSSQFRLYAKVYTDEDYQIAVEKSRSHRWVNIFDSDPVIHLPEQKAILYLFPNDPVIDGLRILSDPRKIQRLLYDNCPEFPESDWRISDRMLRIETMRYKPERRAVLHCKTRVFNRRTEDQDKIRVYLRLYGDDRGAEVFELQRNLYRLARNDGFGIARPIVYLEGRRLLMMKDLRGKPLLGILKGAEAKSALERTSRALAAFHRARIPGLRKRDIGSFLEDAGATSEMLGFIAPDTARQAEEILSILEKHKYLGESRKSGLVHGDFYYSQIILKRNKVAFIDFDRSHAGDCAVDLGNFCAHLRLLRLRGHLDDETGLERVFKETYREASAEDLNEDSLAFWTAYGLYQLAVDPFRRLEIGWREKTENILGECRKVLS
jgi:tRNA A-37 threonylcarbamoyl transferase component Bud32